MEETRPNPLPRKVGMAVGGVILFLVVFAGSATIAGIVLAPAEVPPSQDALAPNAQAYAEEMKIALGESADPYADNAEDDSSDRTTTGATTSTTLSTGTEAGGDPTELADEEVFRGWQSYENKGMGVTLMLPPDFHADYEYDTDVAFLNYDSKRVPATESFPVGKARISLFTLLHKRPGEGIEDYLKKNVTSSSTNILRVEAEIGGRPALVETGVDGAPYESFYIDAGQRLVVLTIFGNPSDYEANKILLSKVAYSVRLSR